MKNNLPFKGTIHKMKNEHLAKSQTEIGRIEYQPFTGKEIFFLQIRLEKAVSTFPPSSNNFKCPLKVQLVRSLYLQQY
jgi:hypothetical protein